MTMPFLLRIGKNALARLSAQGAAHLLALALAALIARFEGPDGLGRYALALSAVGITGGLTDLGLNTFLLRETARADRATRQRFLLGHVLLLKILLSLAGYALLLAAAVFLPFPPATATLLPLAGLLLFPEAVTGAAAALVDARRRMEVTGLLQTAVRLTMVAGAVLLLARGYGIGGVLGWRVAVAGGSVPLYAVLLHRWKLWPQFRWNPTAWRRIIAEAYPFGLTGGVAALYARADLLLLSLWHGEVAAGWYSAAYRLWEALAMLPGGLFFALFPEMARLSTRTDGRSRLRRLFRGGGRIFPAMGLLVAVAGTVWADGLLGLLYGREGMIAAAATPFRVMVWAFPALFLSMLGGRILYAIGQQRQVLRMMVAVGALNIGLNLIAIPRWGILGAGAAALASELALAAMVVRQTRRALAGASDEETVFATGGYVSAQVTLADVNGDGEPEIIAGSDALYVWRADGRLLSGFPAWGRNFFASRPAVGDLNGDGQPEILVGCDDDALYAFDAAGRLLPGWPRRTGGDVYSSPAVADVDGDGRLEVVVGSDDGGVYVWRGDGTLLPGWPQRTDGFVSASPVLADVDGDGRPEVVIGSWDGGVYVWRGDGTPLPGWPQKTGHFVWGAAAVADVDGDGCPEVVVASERVYVWRGDGTPLPGWPQATGSYGVAAPVLADLDGDGRLEIIAASDALYVWRADGRLLSGFPLRLGTYLWASPAVGDVNGDGCPEIVVGGWNGRLYTVGAGGEIRAVWRTGGPIFSPPTLFHPRRKGSAGVLVGSWDGNVYHFRLAESFAFAREGEAQASIPHLREAGQFSRVAEFVAPFIVFPASPARRAILRYRAHFEADWHPVPLVVHRGRLTGLIQPFLAGTRVEYYAEIWPEEGESTRCPPSGVFCYTVRADWRARAVRRLRRLRHRRRRG